MTAEFRTELYENIKSVFNKALTSDEQIRISEINQSKAMYKGFGNYIVSKPFFG